jgi:hypothetical protein
MVLRDRSVSPLVDEEWIRHSIAPMGPSREGGPYPLVSLTTDYGPESSPWGRQALTARPCTARVLAKPMMGFVDARGSGTCLQAAVMLDMTKPQKGALDLHGAKA